MSNNLSIENTNLSLGKIEMFSIKLKLSNILLIKLYILPHLIKNKDIFYCIGPSILKNIVFRTSYPFIYLLSLNKCD